MPTTEKLKQEIADAEKKLAQERSRLQRLIASPLRRGGRLVGRGEDRMQTVRAGGIAPGPRLFLWSGGIPGQKAAARTVRPLLPRRADRQIA